MAVQQEQWQSIAKFSHPVDREETSVERLDAWLIHNNLPGDRYTTANGSQALSITADPHYLHLTHPRSLKPIALPDECSRILFLAVAAADTIEPLLALPNLMSLQPHSLLFVALAEAEDGEAEVKRLFDDRASRDLLGCLSFQGLGSDNLQFRLYRIDQRGELHAALLKGPGRKVGEPADNLEDRARWFTTRE